MMRELVHLYRRRLSLLFFAHKSWRRPSRKAAAPRLTVELLEDRTLPSGSPWNLPGVLAKYDSAVHMINQVSTAEAVINRKLGLNLPLLNQTLNKALNLASDFLTPFQTVLDQNAPDWNSVATELQSAGFAIPLAFTGTPDAHGNLFEVAWSQTWDLPTVPLFVSGSTGFSYLDGSGGLFGAINGSGHVAVTVTVGVDVNAQNQLGFFLLPSASTAQATLTGSTGADGLSGSLTIGDLANVNASATGSVSLTGTLGLQATTSATDGKVRAADLTSNLDQVVTGGVNGSVQLNPKFDAQLTALPDVNWSGVFSEGIQDSVVQAPSVSLQKPSASSLLSSLGASLFSLGDGVPILGPLSNTLNQPLPLINESVAQLTGLDSKLPTLPSLPSGFSALNGTYDLAGGKLTVNVTPATIDQFVHGQNVTLVSWEASGDVSLADLQFTVPVFSLGVPDVASAEIDATFGLKASVHYDVGFGLDTRGFWLRSGDSAQPNFGLTFGVTAGMQGQVEVLGFPLAEAGGNVGLAITPYVTLSAPPWAADRSKVYMSDLALFGSNPLSDVLADMGAGIKGAFTGEVYASVDLFLFSVSWSWGISIPVFNYERHPSWPGQAGANGPVDPWANHVSQNGGLLSFTGTPGNDNLSVAEGSDGAVTLNWAGVGQKTFAGVSEFDFNGNGGNNRLTTAPDFAIPIKAQATGNDYLQGGAGRDTLLGGGGNDTLVAGSGDGKVQGGSGTELLIGGPGHDTLTAGSGTDSIFGGSGDSTINGGAGTESIYAGSGNDLILGGAGTCFIDGGSGSDVINAGTGANDSIYGGSGGHNVITGSSGGHNLIYGGGAGDVIDGGTGGYDTIYGSAGGNRGVVTNNRIRGGALGHNLIFGGGSGDVLSGINGDNTLYAGSGNETLYGGDGQDLAFNPLANGLADAAGDDLSAGNNLLIGGSGNDMMYGDSTGHNTLQAGPGNDTLYAGTGGDYLQAGPGTDALYGANGNDTLQLAFTPAGQPQPQDTIVGGPGTNTLVLRPTLAAGPASASVPIVNGHPQPAAPADYQIYFTQVAGTANQYQATLANLDTGTGIGQLTVTLPADVANIALEGGPGNNWIQVDPSVTRGMYLYGGPGHNTLMAGTGNDVLAAGPGSSVLYGGTGNDVLYGGDLPSQDVQPQLNSAGQVMPRSQPAEGHDTLIAGSGDSELFAGSGGDVLIGGNVARAVGPNGTPGLALLQNGQYQLINGAGRDLLIGGTGNDLLIAGPGSPGAFLQAGTGNDVLVADNDGMNVLMGGAGPVLMIGGNIGNVISAGAGDATLVGGLGLNTLIGGAGNDALYACNPAAWVQAEAAAAAAGVHLVPPNFFQGDILATQIESLLVKQQSQPLSAAEQATLHDDLFQEFENLAAQDNTLQQQIDAVEALRRSAGLTAAQQQELNFLYTQDVAVLNERITVETYLGSNQEVDSLIGGSGNDRFYGSPAIATFMGGGTGNDTFCNYNGNDTIAGGSGSNTVLFQGDGAISLTADPGNPQAVDVTIPGQNSGRPWVVGNFGHISGLKIVGVQTGAANDTINLAFPNSVGLSALVQCGSGTDVVDASAFSGPETLLAGSGHDVIKIGAAIATGSVIQGSATGFSELDVADTNSDPITVNRTTGLKIGGYTEGPSNFPNFQKLVVVGGPGSNSFTTDGSIPNVVLEGGSGSNGFSVSGGTATLVGGSGSNSFTVTGPGNYTVIGGTPTSLPATPATSGVAAPTPAGMTQTTATLSHPSYPDAATTVGTKAFFAGGGSAGVDVYDASTGQWSTATLSVARYGLAATTVGTKAMFAGGWETLNNRRSNVVDIYDASTGQWSTATLSQARESLAATTVGTKAFFAGGATGLPSNVVDIYDASTGQWSMATLSQARGGLAATTVGTKAIFAGGQSWSGVSTAVDIYDASTGQWSTSTISQPRSSLVATTVGTKAIFAGGSSLFGVSNVVDIYDASTGQWSTATLSVARNRLAATTVGTKAIFAGGVALSQASKVVDIYDVSTGGWSTSTLSVGRYDFTATSVGTMAIFAGRDTSVGNTVDIFRVPPALTVTSASSSVNGTATIGYTLIDGPSNPCNIQVQYSVNGGPWQLATAAAGGDGTSNLTAGPAGTAHTFLWNTLHDLGTTNDPSVQVRVTPSDAIGVGVTQTSAPFAVNFGVVNALTIAFTDAGNDTVTLVQTGSTTSFNCSLAGGSLNLIGTATNLTSLTVVGGTGNNRIDASAVQMPVTLNGGTGTGPDTLIGGAGSDILVYSGVGSSYDGSGGLNNTLVYPANAGDLIAFGGRALAVNDQPKPIGSLTRVENFLASGAPAAVNNGTQFFLPVTGGPLTNVAVTSVTVAAGSPAAVLDGGFTDLYPNTTASTDNATINWGDGSTSTGTITSSGGGSFTVSASHIYATNGLRIIVLTVIDPRGSAASAGQSFTGGLALDGSGNLNSFSSGSTFTTIDTGVSSYVVRSLEGTVFALHASGTLWAIPSTGPKHQVDAADQSIALGPDGGLYALHADGSLYAAPAGSVNPVIVDSGVRAIIADTPGDLYKLYTNGSLYELQAGASWTAAKANVKAVALTTDSSAVNVLTNDGNDWLFNGSVWSIVAGPHFALSVAGSVTAGQLVPVTLTVLDTFNNPVPGYTGTVQVADSDGAAVAAAGPPSQHTFTATDNGSYHFSTRFLTAGSQTLTATDASGLTASAAVTVNPAAASLFSIDPPPVPVGTAVPVTVTAYDAYGNVATGYMGTVRLNPVDSHAALPASYTFAAADQGVHTFAVTFNKSGGQKLVAADTTTVGSGAIVISPAPVDLSQSTVSVLSTTVGAGGTVAVMLTARDVHGNQENAGGLTVAFSLAAGSTGGGNFGPVKDNGDGTYVAIFTAGSLLGNDNITGTITGQALTSSPASLVVVAGQPSPSRSTVAFSPGNVQAGSTATVTLAAVDAAGNTEGSDLAVVFGLGRGSAGGNFGPVTYSGNGTYTATFAATTAGSNTITATIGGQALTSAVPTATVTPGPVSLSQSTVAVAQGTVPAGGTTTLTLTARDAYGNLETSGGLTVTFGLGSGNGTCGAVTDNKNGTYVATFTAGTTPGNNSITATINNQPVTAAAAAVTVTPGPVSLSQSTVVAAPSTLTEGSTATVTLTARDAYGNPETSGGLTVTFALGTGSSPLDAKDNGDGTYTATFPGTTPGSFTLTAAINGQAVTAPAPTVLVQSGLSQLRQQYGFYSSGNYYQNYLGLNEKWFLDRQGQWNVLQPNGTVSAWSGGSNLTQVATVGSQVWANPNLLFQAPLVLSQADQTQLSQLRAQYGFHATGNYAQSYNGLNAKWFLDRTGQHWFVIRTDGRLQQWNGVVNGRDNFTTVATVTALVWDDPTWLLQAPLSLSAAAQAQLTTLSQANGFHFSGNYWLNYLGLNEKWFQDGQNNWYYLTPQGTLANGNGIPLAQVDPQVWDDPNLLFEAKLSSSAQAQLTALRQQFGFSFTGNYSQSYGGLNAKWFQDRQGLWYAVRTGGSLQRWNGVVNQVDSFTLVATVGPQVWNDPYLLFGA